MVEDKRDIPTTASADEQDQINVVEIMQQIREKIRQRRGSTGPLYSGVRGADDGPLEEDLRDSLEQAEIWHDKIFIGDLMRPSSTLSDQLLARLRKPLHSLVRFYLDKMCEKQVIFNASVLKALKTLACKSESEHTLAKEVERLRAEVDELRKQMGRLG
ncbi:MAG: hypothetical protein HY675_16110 [Chloroflexi bacterium]|nr:hypothetical protein [Chloroflexota bacterium]